MLGPILKDAVGDFPLAASADGVRRSAPYGERRVRERPS